MSAANSPRDVKFVPETPPSAPHSMDSPQEQIHLSKKPRNYKYWSDDEVKKILLWLTMPENDSKLARNKAQACREVSKTLFDGDENMAISVRSKLMSLEKSYKEAEHLRKQISISTDDEVLINEKTKEVCKFYGECKKLFGGQRSDVFVPQISPSPTALSPSLPYSSASSRPPNHLHPPHHSNNLMMSRHDGEPSSYDNNSSLLPHLNETRLRPLPSPSLMIRNTWQVALPRVPLVVDIPSVDDDAASDHHLNKRKSSNSSIMSNNQNQSTSFNSLKIAKYAAKQASYAAKQAQFEAIRSEHEQQKMEYAIRLAEIELDRDVLSVKRLELELQLKRDKVKS